ncbi:2-phosphosulfolactate phosphatase [Planctomycetales bacterium 10988]|nr:2-phosphosulfolactate phosphatase [Planctomycetales bacterium 10988]
MPRHLEVHFLPTLVEPERLQGTTAVIIDQLRASTTICHALAQGAKQVLACVEVETVRQVASQWQEKNPDQPKPLLGGERQGIRIEGFDLGNSPPDYRPKVVKGRTIIFSTTNGTRAMQQVVQAKEVFIGCLSNLAACVKAIQSAEEIHLLCAGVSGVIAREDIVPAGWMVDALLRIDPDCILNDEAIMAQDIFRQTDCLPLLESSPTAENLTLDQQRTLTERLTSVLKNTLGGRNLTRQGFESDLWVCAQASSLNLVPRLTTFNEPFTIELLPPLPKSFS